MFIIRVTFVILITLSTADLVVGPIAACLEPSEGYSGSCGQCCDYSHPCSRGQCNDWICCGSPATTPRVISPEKSKGQTCAWSSECKHSLHCVSGKCGCSSFQYDYGKECKDKKAPGQICAKSEECEYDLCVSGLCKCPGDQYYDGSCKDPLGHGSECNPSIDNMCESALSCLPDKDMQYRCLCKRNNLYYTTGTCEPIDQLQVKVPSAIRNASHISFDLEAEDYGLSVTYLIEWTSLHDFTDSGQMNASKDSVIVYGLTPGREYNFTVRSVLAGDSYYDEKTTEIVLVFETLPTKPGPVNLAISDLGEPPIILRFQPSEGDVSVYQITLTNGSTSVVQEVTVPEAEYSELQHDTNYSYTITAYNNGGDESEAFEGIFRIHRETDEDAAGADVNVIAIAGGTVAAVVVLACMVVITSVVVWRRRQSSSRSDIPSRDGNFTGVNLRKQENGNLDRVGQKGVQAEYCNTVSNETLRYSMFPPENAYATINEDRQSGFYNNYVPKGNAYDDIKEEGKNSGNTNMPTENVYENTLEDRQSRIYYEINEDVEI